MAETQQIPDWKAAADEIWALMRETDRRMKDTDRQMKETDRRMQETDRLIQENAEQMKDTDRRMQETDRLIQENAEQMKETDRRMQETDKRLEALKKTVERVTGNVGGLNRSLGELIETLIAARLWEKFPDYNLKRAYQRVPIFDEHSRVMTDIDILLSNTNMAMAVEVKRELDRTRDVDEHVKRMELIRRYPPAEVAGKKMLGAMAGGVVNADVQRYAHENGFFVLELAGESVHLVPPPDGFVPRQW